MLKLSDVLGGSFVALPESEVPQDLEMSHERPPVVTTAPTLDNGGIVAPWELARRAAEAEAAKEVPVVSPVAETPVVAPIVAPVVAPAAGIQLPWLKAAQQEALVQAASEPAPVAQPAAATPAPGVAVAEAVVSAPVTESPLLQEAKALSADIEQTISTMADSGNVEGWGATSPAEEAASCEFKNQTDAQDWVIAKGRSLAYSTIDRPDPFDVATMYEWVSVSKFSHMLNRPITSFRMACRHAIATTVLFYEQDVNNFTTISEQKRLAAEIELKEASITEAHQNWKALVDERKIVVAEWDRKVSEARDKWHELRK